MTLRQDRPGQPHLTATYARVRLKSVLSELGALLNRTIISSAAAEKILITAHIVDQRWDEALAAVFRALGLQGVETPDGILTVTLASQQPPRMLVLQTKRMAGDVAALLRPRMGAASSMVVDSAANRLVFFIDSQDRSNYPALVRVLDVVVPRPP